MPAVVPQGGGQTKHKSSIAKADELPVHNRKGVGNQKEKGGGGTLKFEAGKLFQHTGPHSAGVSVF